jgi:hypothetical protein
MISFSNEICVVVKNFSKFSSQGNSSGGSSTTTVLLLLLIQTNLKSLSEPDGAT